MGPAVLWVGVPWLSIFLPEIVTVFRVCVLVCVGVGEAGEREEVGA